MIDPNILVRFHVYVDSAGRPVFPPPVGDDDSPSTIEMFIKASHLVGITEVPGRPMAILEVEGRENGVVIVFSPLVRQYFINRGVITV